MSVTIEGEPDDMLISIHESSESLAPSMKTAVRRNMRDDNGLAINFLKCCQLLFKPGHLISWIAHLFKQEEVQIVANLSVKGDDFGILEFSSVS